MSWAAPWEPEDRREKRHPSWPGALGHSGLGTSKITHPPQSHHEEPGSQ